MTRGDARRLPDRPWPEVGRPVLLVPLGSTEQHGPHLPLDTDVVVASVVAEALAARLSVEGVDAVVAPAIAYGASGEHQDFPGTISIGTEALTMLLVEFGRSACEWAARVVFVNGHGGNVDALATAVPTLRSENRDASWLPCAADVPGDPHAGRTETSLMLATYPARVRVERIEAGNDAPLAELMAELRTGGVRGVSPNGVLGDPRGASSEEGERLLDAVVAQAWSRLSMDTVDDRGCLVSAPAGAGS